MAPIDEQCACGQQSYLSSKFVPPATVSRANLLIVAAGAGWASMLRDVFFESPPFMSQFGALYDIRCRDPGFLCHVSPPPPHEIERRQ